MSDGLDALVDQQDRDYAASISDPAEREIVVATLLRHRAPERIGRGDRVPAISVLRLETGDSVRLDRLAASRPVVLVFGSYT